MDYCHRPTCFSVCLGGTAATNSDGSCSAVPERTCPVVKIGGEDIQLLPKLPSSAQLSSMHGIIGGTESRICSKPGNIALKPLRER